MPPMHVPALPLRASGCYLDCSVDKLPSQSICPDGTGCVRVLIERPTTPCYDCLPGECCQSCVTDFSVCLPSYPVADGFESDLVSQAGCGSSETIRLWASNDAGDLVMAISFGGSVLGLAKQAGSAEDESFQIDAGTAVLTLGMGQDAASLYCSGGSSVQLDFEASATTGTVDVHAVPPPAGQTSSQGTVTVTLTDVLFGTPKFGVFLPHYEFTDIAL